MSLTWPPPVHLWVVKDRVFCRITGKTSFLSRVGRRSKWEEDNSLRTGIFFLHKDDETVFCNLLCLAGNSGWDVEGRVVQGCQGREERDDLRLHRKNGEMPPWQYWCFSFALVKKARISCCFSCCSAVDVVRAQQGHPANICCASHPCCVAAWGLGMVTTSHHMQQPTPFLESQLEFVDLKYAYVPFYSAQQYGMVQNRYSLRCNVCLECDRESPVDVWQSAACKLSVTLGPCGVSCHRNLETPPRGCHDAVYSYLHLGPMMCVTIHL